jgi:hypothetical protein
MWTIFGQTSDFQGVMGGCSIFAEEDVKCVLHTRTLRLFAAFPFFITALGQSNTSALVSGPEAMGLNDFSCLI